MSTFLKKLLPFTGSFGALPKPNLGFTPGGAIVASGARPSGGMPPQTKIDVGSPIVGVLVGPFLFPSWQDDPDPRNATHFCQENSFVFGPGIGDPQICGRPRGWEQRCTDNPGDANCGMVPHDFPIKGFLIKMTDPGSIPETWAPFLQSVLFNDVEGGKRSFGNYWFLDSMGTMGWKDQGVTLTSYRNWVTALGIQPNQDYYLPFLPVWARDIPFPWNFAHWWNGTPVAMFNDPATGKPWGVFLELVQRGTGVDHMNSPGSNFAQTCPEYDSPALNFDSPFDLYVYVVPFDNPTLNNRSKWNADGSTSADFVKCHSWLEGLNPFNWIKAIVGELKNLTCDLLNDPAAVAAFMAYSGKGATGIVSNLTAKCNAGKNPTINCKDATHANFPPCTAGIIPMPTTPTWVYVIGGVALLGGLVMLFGGKKRASAPPPPT